MRPLFILLITISMLTGCGQDPNAPVYDTANNPNNFPQAAIDLLTAVEEGKPSSFEETVMRFADLYTTESSLLDNQEWKQVIDKLGYKFVDRAKKAVASGLPGLTAAASNYMLASFAHPEDRELARIGRLFMTWNDRLTEDSTGQFEHLAQAGLEQRVGLLREFELADSLSRAFSVQYLRPVILGDNGLDSFSPEQLQRLRPVDSCLLEYTGLMPGSAQHTPLAEWGEPGIQLVAAEVTPTRPGWYLVEIYFIPSYRLESDYSIALRAVTKGVDSENPQDTLGFIPFDFSPVNGTSQWQPGSIIATAKPIYFDQPLGELQVGFYLRDQKGSQLKLTGSDRTMFSLSIADQP